MIWQPARIVSVGQQKMTLLFSASSPECARCARGEGCGAGVFSRLLVYGNTRLVLPVQPGLQPGDRVSVGVERRRLALAAVLRYGLPLIVFLVFAAAGHILADMSPGRDAAALLAGLVGFTVAALAVDRGSKMTLNPVMRSLSFCGNTDRFFQIHPSRTDK